MSKAAYKSAAQTLFDRVLVTWIYPEIQRRIEKNLVTAPLNLMFALIVWQDAKNPTILLNDEVDGKIAELQVYPTEPTVAGQPVDLSKIRGLKQIRLIDSLRKYPFLFLVQANQRKFYLLSKKLSVITGNNEFGVLHELLATEGVQLNPSEYQIDIYLDVIRNQYDLMPSPSRKRGVVMTLAGSYIEAYKHNATACVKRHLRLPTVLIPREDEFLPLLYEARQTYIAGHFFSCIASTATTADRICNRLTVRYGLPTPVQKWFLGETLGNKIPKLRAERIITKDQEELLVKINKIRNRHLHPRRSISQITLKRDAYVAVRLLHELIEGTFSIFRDHTFQEGRIVPKPLV